MKRMFNLSVGILMLAGIASLSSCKKAAVKKPAGPPAELTAVRNALQAYYGDHDGIYPASLDELIGEGKYLKELPKVKIPGHPAINAVKYIKAPALGPENLDDAGGFAYYNSDKYPDTMGALVLNCKHKSEKGLPQYTY